MAKFCTARSQMHHTSLSHLPDIRFDSLFWSAVSSNMYRENGTLHENMSHAPNRSFHFCVLSRCRTVIFHCNYGKFVRDYSSTGRRCLSCISFDTFAWSSFFESEVSRCSRFCIDLLKKWCLDYVLRIYFQTFVYVSSPSRLQKLKTFRYSFNALNFFLVHFRSLRAAFVVKCIGILVSASKQPAYVCVRTLAAEEGLSIVLSILMSDLIA